MDTQSIGPYSPTTIYGQLTSPFTPKQITINAHTPYDKIDEEEQSKVFSREYFQGRPQAKIVYELPETERNFDLNKYIPAREEDEKKQEFTPPELSVFSASSISSKDIVHQSLQRGYSPEQAIVIKNAQASYKNSAVLTDDPARALSTCSYKVS